MSALLWLSRVIWSGERLRTILDDSVAVIRDWLCNFSPWERTCDFTCVCVIDIIDTAAPLVSPRPHLHNLQGFFSGSSGLLAAHLAASGYTSPRRLPHPFTHSSRSLSLSRRRSLSTALAAVSLSACKRQSKSFPSEPSGGASPTPLLPPPTAPAEIWVVCV